MRYCLLPIILFAFLSILHKQQAIAIPISTNANKLHLSESGNCRCTDSLNLVVFYNTLDGPNWVNDWDFSLPMDEWNGILLNGDGCVESINLNSNNLSGVLPEEIGLFSTLKRLSLGLSLIHI